MIVQYSVRTPVGCGGEPPTSLPGELHEIEPEILDVFCNIAAGFGIVRLQGVVNIESSMKKDTFRLIAPPVKKMPWWATPGRPVSP